MEPNFIIADFMGEERCRCCDFGWDGISRSIHYECCICKKHHMPSRLPYHTDTERLMEVVEKLRQYGIATYVDNSHGWSAKVSDHVCEEQSLHKAIYGAIVKKLSEMKERA